MLFFVAFFFFGRQFALLPAAQKTSWGSQNKGADLKLRLWGGGWEEGIRTSSFYLPSGL